MRAIAKIERELTTLTTSHHASAAEAAQLHALTTTKLLCEINPIEHFHTNTQLARHNDVTPLEQSQTTLHHHQLNHTTTTN